MNLPETEQPADNVVAHFLTNQYERVAERLRKRQGASSIGNNAPAREKVLRPRRNLSLNAGSNPAALTLSSL